MLARRGAGAVAAAHGPAGAAAARPAQQLTSVPRAQFNMNLIEAGHVASYSGLMNVCSRASGGWISDLVARRWGMRGRLWWLWFVQTAAGGVCLAMGFQTDDLGKSITCMVIFSYLMQAACGATFGVVPFISKRSLGTVSGFVGAGGNTIAAIITCVH